MELSAILPHVEALIFASEKPLTSLELTELINNALGFLDDKITLDQIEAAVLGVIEKYDSDFYPFEIRESGGGWQFLTKRDYHKTVAQLNGDKFLKRLSAASLETLAIIAYKQPITKGEIESIRGVNSDYSIQKLLEKELIIITGRNEELPGKPLVYATSKTFMDYFGINSPDELPMIKDVLSSQVLEPTQVPQVNHGLFSDGPVDEVMEGDLVVRANGELIEEPQNVIEKSAEVVEPEQVIGEDAPDDVVADANGDEGFADDDQDGAEDQDADDDESVDDESEPDDSLPERAENNEGSDIESTLESLEEVSENDDADTETTPDYEEENEAVSSDSGDEVVSESDEMDTETTSDSEEEDKAASSDSGEEEVSESENLNVDDAPDGLDVDDTPNAENPENSGDENLSDDEDADPRSTKD